MANLGNLFELSKLCNENYALLVAVSKTKPNKDIMEVYDSGHKVFGENKVQELVEKHEALPKDIKWHMIGHLQRNKVKYIAPFVDLIHAVDSIRLAKEINKQAKLCHRRIKVLLQIHIAEESTKHGFSFMELQASLQKGDFHELKHIEICGLMGMATFVDDKNQVSKEFSMLKSHFNDLRSTYFKDEASFKEMSMGMSGDYKIALEHGSTMIRVGSAIFGSR